MCNSTVIRKTWKTLGQNFLNFNVILQYFSYTLVKSSGQKFASFIKISSGHSKIKLIFIKFFRTIWEIGGQMLGDKSLAE